MVERSAPRSESTIIFTVMPLYTRKAVRMLALTASDPASGSAGSIDSPSMWPK